MEFTKEADLATEAYTRDIKSEEKNGIKTTSLLFGETEVIKTEILNELGKEKTGKEIGEYLTVVVGDVYKYTESEKERIISTLTLCITSLISTFKYCPRRFLVVGLGSKEILADSLGTQVLDELVPSAHLRGETEIYNSLGYDLTLLSAGVRGQSGLDACEHIKSILPASQAEAVICIDSLLTFDKERLLKTIQISNTGILPGSAKSVSGCKKITSSALLGTPVISLGVPTAIKMHPRSSYGNDQTLYTPCDVNFSLSELSKLISRSITNAIKQYF